MSNSVVQESLRPQLLAYFESHKKAELVSTYLFFMGLDKKIQPVVYAPGKRIYKGADEAVAAVEAEGKLWRQTQIRVDFGDQSVNEATKRVYICPFTGKVFADNTHPNPQDAIYDWVSRCPENTDRVNGLPVKRFFVSEDPEIIRGYIKPQTHSVTKTVYSSVLNGRLFATKSAVIDDFKTTLKPIPMAEIQNQNRFDIEEKFLSELRSELSETNITKFVEDLATDEVFAPHVAAWLE